MMTHLPRDSKELLSGHPEKIESRSLLLSKYVETRSKEKEQQKVFDTWLNRLASNDKVKDVPRWQPPGNKKESILFGHLQARMLINMSGSIAENANLSVDRYGLPFIPGSAVKGCARRMAIQSLIETSTPEEKVARLTEIALIFGWGDTEWKPGRNNKNHVHSDFWYAMAEEDPDKSKSQNDSLRDTQWNAIEGEVKQKITVHLDMVHGYKNGRAFPASYAGEVSFLAAYPVNVTMLDLNPKAPILGLLEKDIITSHHSEYYGKKSTHMVAYDDEQPIPVCFPSIAAGHVFQFIVLPRKGTQNENDLQSLGLNFLKDGLSQMGIGAKTAAGYGWFDTSENLQQKVSGHFQKLKDLELKRLENEKQKADEARIQQEKTAKNREQKEKLASMSGEEKLTYKLKSMERSTLIPHVTSIQKRSDQEMEAIYQMFKDWNQELWNEVTQKAQQGNKKDRKKFVPLFNKMKQIANVKGEEI